MMLQNASFQTTRPPWLDRWADFAVTVTPDSLPGDVVTRTKQVLFDCIGAIAAGAQEPEMQRLTARLCRASAGQQPRNMLAAKFSLPFSLATTVVNGAASISAFRDDARRDAVTLALAGRITVREDKALTEMLPGLRPARVKITLVDGRVLGAEAFTPSARSLIGGHDV